MLSWSHAAMVPRSQGPTARISTYVAVAAEVLEQLDLAQGALGEDLLAEDIGDLLDGDALLGLVVDGGAVGQTDKKGQRHGNWGRRGSSKSGAESPLPYDAVGALAELLGNGVPLVDDEVLVEDLEDLASLQIAHGDGLLDLWM